MGRRDSPAVTPRKEVRQTQRTEAGFPATT